MFRRFPLGLPEERPPSDGTATHAGSRTPGPLGDDVAGTSAWTPAGSGTDAQGKAERPVSVRFSLGTDHYRLCQIGTVLGAGLNETRVRAAEAPVVIARALEQHGADASLREILATASTRLAGVHDRGIFMLLRLRPQLPSAPAPRIEPTVTPAALVPPRVEDTAPEVEALAMGMAQAEALKQAAAVGVPFCEECDAARKKGAA